MVKMYCVFILEYCILQSEYFFRKYCILDIKFILKYFGPTLHAENNILYFN